MRKYFIVIDREVNKQSLIFASDQVDALSFATKRVCDENRIVECRDVFVYNRNCRYQFTKLSELPDDSVFYRVLEALGHTLNYTSDVPLIKVSNMANGMVRCRCLYDTIQPDCFFKGSTKVAILPPEVQECLKSGTV